jgi:hypothetical protein
MEVFEIKVFFNELTIFLKLRIENEEDGNLGIIFFFKVYLFLIIFIY